MTIKVEAKPGFTLRLNGQDQESPLILSPAMGEQLRTFAIRYPDKTQATVFVDPLAEGHGGYVVDEVQKIGVGESTEIPNVATFTGL